MSNANMYASYNMYNNTDFLSNLIQKGQQEIQMGGWGVNEGRVYVQGEGLYHCISISGMTEFVIDQLDEWQ